MSETAAPPNEDLRKVAPLSGSKKAKRVHTPTVLQMEAVECGAAALASVLGFYGRYVPLEKLRIDCGVSRDGSSANNLLGAARAYGLKAQGKKLGLKDIGSYNVPLIVHWNFDHFVVVEGIDKSWIYLNDPAQGPRRVTREEFEEAFTGVAIAFEPSSHFEKGGHPPSVVASLRKRMKGSESALAYVVLVSLLLVLPGLALPTFVRTFVDKVLVGSLDEWLRPLVLGLALAALLSGILTALQQYTLRAMETRFSLTSSARFFWHVLRLPMDFYSQRYAGDVGSRVALNDHVASLLSGQLATASLNMIVVFLYAALMFTYDVSLTLISIGIAVLNLLVLTLVARKRRDGNTHVMQEEGKLMGMAMGGLQIIETLKATGTESNFFARWAGQQTKVLNAQQTLGIYTQILQVAPAFLSTLNTALILWIGAGRVIDGRMSLGMLVAFETLAISFMTPVTQLVGLGTALQDVSGSLARLDDVLRYDVDERLSEQRPVAASADGPARLSGRVELRDVTFGYSSLAPPLIEGLNLTLNPGDRVAIVGGTGSGKSTLARLVAGLNRPWGGEILFDDRPHDQIDRHVLTDSIAHVDQEIALFEGTLRENLTLWDPSVSQASLIRAARDAAIHEGIMNRPNGYNTAVDEGGANFSGGQRQRLEIARTLVGEPTILVLDEATSALDPIVEGQIDNNLRRRGCTCLIIAHRLSTIRDCSEIIVLDRGKVVERGTHAEMVKNDGPYLRLIQAELAAEPAPLEIDVEPALEESSKDDDKVPPTTVVEQGEEWERRTSYLLCDDSAGWVKTGFLDLFAVSVEQGEPRGTRRYLARIQQGQAVFGLAQPPEELSLVAVPGPDTVILTADLGGGPKEEMAPLLAGWVEGLSNALGVLAGTSGGAASLVADQELRLEPGQQASTPKELLWVRVAEGEVAYLGRKNGVLPKDAPPVPLSRRTWLQARAPVSLTATSTATLLKDGNAQQALAHFHKLLLECLKEQRAHTLKADLARAEARENDERNAVSGALFALASIIREGVTLVPPSYGDDDALLAACTEVTRFAGIELEVSELSKQGRPPGPGSTSQEELLDSIARASHFRHRKVILRSDWWAQDNGPLLGFLRSGEESASPGEAPLEGQEEPPARPPLGMPVALLPTSPSSYDRVEAGNSKRKRVKATTASELYPIAYQFYRPFPRLAVTASNLLSFALRGCRRDILTTVAMGILGGLLGMALPIVTGFLVNQVIPAADRSQVTVLGMILLVITITTALFEFTRAIAVQRIEGKMDATVQPAVWDRILALPTSFFRSNSAGDLATRAMSIESMRETITGATVSAILGAIFSVFSLGLMFYYDFTLALLALVPISGLVCFTVVAGLYQVRLERSLLHIQGRISGLVLQLLNGISKIRVAGAEGRAFARWGRDFAEQKQLSWRQLGVSNRLTVFNSTFAMIAAIIVFLGVTHPAKGTRLSTGDFLAFYAAFGQFAGALLALSSSLTSTLSALPMFERARPILDALPETSELRANPGILRGEVELSQVNFGYSADGPAVLMDVSVRAAPGEFIAIVGPSGSGKSTLFRHLLGFEKPDSGAVYFDGQDLQDIDVSSVRRQMGVVLQDSKLMPGDILQNIIGSSGKTIEDALEAVRSAGMEKDIEEMPMGLHTVVMEGGGAFSGGQRQRLMIARAIVGRPRILLFDEATSALDSETQESVTRNLENLAVTRIVIAHRLSTIRNADRIYVMEAGRVVQSGTFDALMNQPGTFEKLVKPQVLG